MVVLSAAICTKSGKGTDSKQHTFVETDSVRYVYQPMENLFLLLITNRASNIIEDLETLRLLSKVVPDVAGTANNLTEEKITDKCFELIFAFDEVITNGGYREPITLQQIRTNMEMESHEEKLHNMIKVSKMESARDQAKDAAKVIRERQRDQHRAGISSVDSALQSMGTISVTRDVEESTKPLYTPTAPSQKSSTTAGPAKGMSLTSKSAKNKSLEEALVKEDKLAPIAVAGAARGVVAVQEQVAPASVVQHPIMLAVVEKVSAHITRDGAVIDHDVKGSLTLTALTDEAGMCSVQLAVGANASDYTFNTHPKLNKALYDKSSLLRLKDPTKGFPSARPVGILKWSYGGTSEDMIPLKINCWPEEEGRGQMSVSIEYSMEQDITLHNVKIKIPLGTTSTALNIANISGNYKHNASNAELVWDLDVIDRSNSTGSLEFTIPQKNTDAFFPIEVSFSSTELFCKVDVTSVTSADGSTPLQYGLSKHMSTEEYVIQ